MHRDQLIATCSLRLAIYQFLQHSQLRERYPVASYSTNEFRKGLKVQIDGVPYQMIEMNL